MLRLTFMGLVICLSSNFMVGAESYRSTLSIVGGNSDARGQLHIVLRNGKSTTVSAFSLRHPDGAIEIEEFLPPKQSGILPGVNYDFAFPLNPSASDVERNVNSYSITGVVFADGSSEGLAADVNQIVTLRAGRAYGLRQLLPTLEGLRHSQKGTLAEDIHAAAAAIASRPLTLEDGTQATGLFANGLQSAHRLTAGQLEKTENLMRASSSDNGDKATSLLERLISDHKITLAGMENSTIR